MNNKKENNLENNKKILEIRKKIDIEMNKKNENDIDLDIIHQCLDQYNAIDNTPTPDFSDLKKTIISESKRISRMRKTIFSVAACIVIIISMNFVSYAFGVDIFSTVAEWTKQTIEYLNKNLFLTGNKEGITTDDISQYTSPKDAMEKENMKALIIKELPDGYELINVTYSNYGINNSILIQYGNKSFSILYQISPANEEYRDLIKKMASLDIDKYTVKDINFYLTGKENWYQVEWIYNDLYCIISGNMSYDDMKNILNSLKPINNSDT